MNLTKQQLQQLIQEELRAILNEQGAYVDAEGNPAPAGMIAAGEAFPAELPPHRRAGLIKQGYKGWNPKQRSWQKRRVGQKGAATTRQLGLTSGGTALSTSDAVDKKKAGLGAAAPEGGFDPKRVDPDTNPMGAYGNKAWWLKHGNKGDGTWKTGPGEGAVDFGTGTTVRGGEKVKVPLRRDKSGEINKKARANVSDATAIISDMDAALANLPDVKEPSGLLKRPDLGRGQYQYIDVKKPKKKVAATSADAELTDVLGKTSGDPYAKEGPLLKLQEIVQEELAAVLKEELPRFKRPLPGAVPKTSDYWNFPEERRSDEEKLIDAFFLGMPGAILGRKKIQQSIEQTPQGGANKWMWDKIRDVLKTETAKLELP